MRGLILSTLLLYTARARLSPFGGRVHLALGDVGAGHVGSVKTRKSVYAIHIDHSISKYLLHWQRGTCYGTTRFSI